MFGFGKSSRGSKLKPQLKMAVSRFQISANKKSALQKQQIREIALLLQEDPPKEEKAMIRGEALIREDNTVEAYEVLQLECELLAERVKLIEASKECPADLVSVVSTVIWAESRCDIPELSLIRKSLRSKFGKDFEDRALNNVGGVLNERVVAKLSLKPPAAYLVQVYLQKVCEIHEVDWEPSFKLTPEQMSEPMTAPVGYSVPMASASGLGPPVNTGQAHADDESMGTNKRGMMSPPAEIVAPAMPYEQQQSQQQDYFQEPDIFVPAIPAAPTDDDDKSDTLPPPAPGAPNDAGSVSSSSYADLAARFNRLKK